MEAAGRSDELFASVYHPTRTRSFDADECFLCGARLAEDNRTVEHVFPKWLLTEFDLWDQKMDLLNRSAIPYRQLVIPCCHECNTGPLSRIETQVEAAYGRGYDGFVELDRDVLFLWLAKIVYGLLVRELFLFLDRRQRDEGPIVPPELLDELRTHHLLLQAARGVVTWDRFPASIILLRTKVSPVAGQNFDFADSIIGPTLTMRLGPIGVLAVLQDWGTFEGARFPKVEQVRDHPLAPLQFRELMAFTRYAASKYRLNPGLVIGGEKNGPQRVMFLGSLARYAYDEFDSEELGSLTAFVMGIPVEQVVFGDLCMTWLVNADGPIDAPFDARPAPTTES